MSAALHPIGFGSRLMLVAFLAGGLAACTPSTSGEDSATDKSDGGTGGGGGGGGSGSGSGDGGDGDAGSGSGDDTTDPPEPETVCDDGVDNDSDGATDCEDSDCAEATWCQWPASMAHEGAYDFDAQNNVECIIRGFPVDIDVSDCITRYTAELTPVTDAAEACPTCDRTYYGTLTYSENTCAAALPALELPTDAYFGFIFTTDTEWQLVGKGPSGDWDAAVELTVSGDGFEFATTETINISDDRCSNSPLYVGDLTVTWAFSVD